MKSDQPTYVHLSNSPLIEEMYEKYLVDPSSIDASWRYFFEGLELGQGGVSKSQSDDNTGKIRKLIDAYRMYGHIIAKVNPLRHLCHYDDVQELKLSKYGLKESDLNKKFPTFGVLPKKEATLKEIIQYLEATYCSTMGIEYIGFVGLEFERWLQEKIEPMQGDPKLSIDQKRLTLEYLNKSELFEAFLQLKYTGQKRFSVEGGETFIPMLQSLIVHGSSHGMEEFVIGMAHRGRLNVLCNIMNKSYSHIFCEFEKGYVPHESEGVSDVKYHKGYTSEVELDNGKKVQILLASNPSHLESVNPVVEGQALARQLRKGDDGKSKIVPILVHGDAALAGQGVVYETMQLGRIHGYDTGGTIHIVVNNHLGFTALPSESRSTNYCTDIAKTFGAPVFHVNAEDPEKCILAINLAVEIRQKYHCDVFIDLSCYRKYGHNESDEPMFTQPLHYKEIKNKKTIRELYREELINQGVLEKQMANELEKKFKEALQEDLEKSKTFKADPPPVDLGKSWEGFLRFPSKEIIFKEVPTGVKESELLHIADAVSKIPDGFNLHKKLVRLVGDRRGQLDAPEDEASIEWGTAEQLAFGALLREGVSIRISGQDSKRGTFSHRQAVWVDQETQEPFIPLSTCENQSSFHVYNSALSEEGILGFETGYSMGYPQSLVIWEAQFGDFANGAQAIIDEYVTACESKWGNLTGITLFLPHGYEGQGPDHSSARVERFLQMAADLNMFVVMPSTPAQLFHLLRRQMHALYRKPLIVFTPKSLLRYPACKSSRKDLVEGSFSEIIEDELEDKTTSTLVFCTGKVYYSLKAEEKTRGWDPFACIRVEQLFPFNEEKVKQAIAKYPNLKKILWVQEEPKNMGAWEYIRDPLEEVSGITPTYVGSGRLATPEMGTFTAYQERLMSIYNQFEMQMKG